MKRILNYIGQLRIYSLIDLILLLIALKTDSPQFIGAIILHIAFLAYLESRHSHPYRAKIPRQVSYILAVIGIIVYGKIEAIAYLLFGFLYTKKIKNLGYAGPFFRGLQNLFIVAGIIGYTSPFTYFVALLLFLRNLAGDFRDAGKDKKEGMNTIPVIIGVNKNIKDIHLIATILTSSTWWHFSTLSFEWLVIVIVIEILTYHLTPR